MLFLFSKDLCVYCGNESEKILIKVEALSFSMDSSVDFTLKKNKSDSMLFIYFDNIRDFKGKLGFLLVSICIIQIYFFE